LESIGHREAIDGRYNRIGKEKSSIEATSLEEDIVE